MVERGLPIPIVFLITGLGVGGAETQLVRVVTHLDRHRWSPIVVSMYGRASFADDLAAANITLYSLDLRFGFGAFRGIARLMSVLRQIRPSLLISFMFHANVLGRLIAPLAGCPVVVSSVRTQRMGGRLRELLMRWTDCLSHYTTTNSQVVADYLVKRRIVHRDKVRVIPNGLPPNVLPSLPLHPAIPTDSLGVEVAGRFVWIAVGRLVEAKDYATLLESFATIVKSTPQALLLVAGSGHLEESLRAKTSGLELESHVWFLGNRTDVPVLLQIADAFVLSSAWEGMPNALMEAMAMGLPVVATRVGGVSEIVEDGVTGFTVDPQNPGALGAAMLRVMGLTVEERKRLGQAARVDVSQRFSLEAVLRQWEQLWMECLSR